MCKPFHMHELIIFWTSFFFSLSLESNTFITWSFIYFPSMLLMVRIYFFFSFYCCWCSCCLSFVKCTVQTVHRTQLVSTFLYRRLHSCDEAGCVVYLSVSVVLDVSFSAEKKNEFHEHRHLIRFINTYYVCSSLFRLSFWISWARHLFVQCAHIYVCYRFFFNGYVCTETDWFVVVIFHFNPFHSHRKVH